VPSLRELKLNHPTSNLTPELSCRLPYTTYIT
jgi:hypothetical protein